MVLKLLDFVKLIFLEEDEDSEDDFKEKDKVKSREDSPRMESVSIIMIGACLTIFLDQTQWDSSKFGFDNKCGFWFSNASRTGKRPDQGPLEKNKCYSDGNTWEWDC